MRDFHRAAAEREELEQWTVPSPFWQGVVICIVIEAICGVVLWWLVSFADSL